MFIMDWKTLVKILIDAGYLRTKRIIDAFLKIDRRSFLPKHLHHLAYEDIPLPIMKGQTISQPSTVAIMLELLQPQRGQRILEVGSGSGYQAALLAEIVGKNGLIVTIERIKELYDYARKKLKSFDNVIIIHGDGTLGYEEKAPYDRIIVTAAAPHIPSPLKDQLKVEGRLVIPVGSPELQRMVLLIKRNENNWERKEVGYFRFVPLIGKYGFRNFENS